MYLYVHIGFIIVVVFAPVALRFVQIAPLRDELTHHPQINLQNLPLAVI